MWCHSVHLLLIVFFFANRIPALCPGNSFQSCSLDLQLGFECSSLLAFTVGYDSTSKHLLASAFLIQSSELRVRSVLQQIGLLPTFSAPSPGAAARSPSIMKYLQFPKNKCSLTFFHPIISSAWNSSSPLPSIIPPFHLMNLAGEV